MKVTITTLKAPWPKGAKVGDVVVFEGDTAPAWAVGKFAVASDDVEADHTYKPEAPKGGVLLDGSAEAFHIGAGAPLVDAAIADLKADLAAAADQLAASVDDANDQRRIADDLRGKLDVAEKALAAQKPAASKKA